MSIARKLHEFLQGQGTGFDVVAHPRTMSASGSAQAAHVPGSRLAKAVVVHHELGYMLAVVPSTHRVELGTLQEILGRRLGLATEGEVAKLFDDCDLGAVPPIGAAYGLPVAIDDSLDAAPDVYFEGGDHTTLVHVSAAAFKSLTKEAQHARFSHPA